MVIETYEIQVIDPSTVENYLAKKKNPSLAAEATAFINSHFNVTIGDLLKVTFEFVDYHGMETYLSVEQFVPTKIQVHQRLYWQETTGK